MAAISWGLDISKVLGKNGAISMNMMTLWKVVSTHFLPKLSNCCLFVCLILAFYVQIFSQALLCFSILVWVGKRPIIRAKGRIMVTTKSPYTCAIFSWRSSFGLMITTSCAFLILVILNFMHNIQHINTSLPRTFSKCRSWSWLTKVTMFPLDF